MKIRRRRRARKSRRLNGRGRRRGVRRACGHCGGRRNVQRIVVDFVGRGGAREESTVGREGVIAAARRRYPRRLLAAILLLLLIVVVIVILIATQMTRPIERQRQVFPLNRRVQQSIVPFDNFEQFLPVSIRQT